MILCKHFLFFRLGSISPFVRHRTKYLKKSAVIFAIDYRFRKTDVWDCKNSGRCFLLVLFFGSKENEHSFFFMLRDQGELSIFPLAPLTILLPPSNECSFAARLFYHSLRDTKQQFSLSGFGIPFLLSNGLPKKIRRYFCN